MHTLGIDFGTTKTLVSRIDAATGQPVTIRLGMGTDYIPTTVYIEENGQIYFGEDADDRLADNTGAYIRGFKMRLGSAMPLHIQFGEDGSITKICARDLVREYLSYIRERVERQVFMQEGSARKAVITRPVNFSPVQLEELKQAALDAGFSEVTLTTEPEAAGLAFCRLNASKAFNRSALIVDWGGGTLDFALVTRDGNTIHTHPRLTDGDTTMGGERFDEVLWNYTEQQLRQQGYTHINPILALPVIRRAKERLSIGTQTTIRLTYQDGACPPVHITRDIFNALIIDNIEQATHKVQQLIAAIPAAHKPEMLLLVGGSCLIPLIKEHMESACGLPAYSWNLSREAVGLGAVLSNAPALATPPAPTSAPMPPAAQQHRTATPPAPVEPKTPEEPKKSLFLPQKNNTTIQQPAEQTPTPPPTTSGKTPVLPKKPVTSKIQTTQTPQKTSGRPKKQVTSKTQTTTSPQKRTTGNVTNESAKAAPPQQKGSGIFSVFLLAFYASAIYYDNVPDSMWYGLGIVIGVLGLIVFFSRKNEALCVPLILLYSPTMGYIWAARYGGTADDWSFWWGLAGLIGVGIVLLIIGMIFVDIFAPKKK